MFAAIDIGLSGMDAYTKGLQVIANNVANLNTPGFKANTANFSDMFNNDPGEIGFSSGGPSSDQTGNGVVFGQSSIDFSQGTLQQTNGDLDLAIQGGGFLVLQDGAKTLYARTGSFFVDKDGFISEQGTGFHLAVLSSAGQPTALNINSDRTSPPQATTSVTFSDNLSSSGTADTVSSIAVFDSAGAQHTWQVQMAADSQNPGTWNVTVTDESGATVGTGTVKFIGSTIDPTTAKLTISTTPKNASPLSVVLDFSSVTSFSAGTTSTLQVASTDGHALGSLTSITIDGTGQVKLTYSNNQTKLEGPVALADFVNPEALTQQSGGVFANDAGAKVRLRASGVDGMGTLVSKQIEASNVDLSREFGELILIQRGFQASSQVVSVANDMIQQLFGIRGQG
ncbi:MAG: flagellar hook protein FlgE [Caulobacterales bacterium]